MHALLQKLLRKRGIETTSELSPEEELTYDTWNKILSEDELTVEKIKEFCQVQVGIIEGKWSDLNIENYKKAEWLPYHTVYKMILAAIDSPKSAREALERQLNELLNIKNL